MTDDPSGSLAGKVAIVTGSARNIGRETAKVLAADGASVIINAVQDKDAADAVAAEINDAGGKAFAHLCDVTDRKAVDSMVEAAVDAFGGVDILICNASSRGQKAFTEMTHEEWRRVIDISLDGAFFLSQACILHMIEKGWGRIVTLGGVAWHVGAAGRVHNLVAKSGLVGFTRGLAAEFADRNITVNCVSPGHTDTVRPASAGTHPPTMALAPVGRLGQPGEIASMVRYLCQTEAAFITGQVMHVNGGLYYGT